MLEANQIEKWWPQVDTETKQWLRENQGSANIPGEVHAKITQAGGPANGLVLSDEDWQFIRTQSESVD